MDTFRKWWVTALAALASAFLFLVGLAGAPDDIQQWREWFVALLDSGVPWWMFIVGSLVLGGVAVLPWALPHLPRRRRAPSFTTDDDGDFQIPARRRDGAASESSGDPTRNALEEENFQLKRQLREAGQTNHDLSEQVATLEEHKVLMAGHIVEVADGGTERTGKLSSDLAEARSEIASLAGERDDLLSRGQERERAMKEQARERAALEKRADALERIVNPPPPDSDLTPHERAVAFNEIGKILKRLEQLNPWTRTLLDKAAERMKAKHGAIAADLNGFLVDRLGTPSSEHLGNVRAEITDGSSAERAQDALLGCLTVYNSQRRWLHRSAEYGELSLAGLASYDDWYLADTALWSALDEIPDTGPLRRLEAGLRRWYVYREVPYEMPKPSVSPATQD